MIWVYLALRLLHIVFGALWVGVAALTAFVVHPAAKNHESGTSFLQTFYGNSLFPRLVPVLAITTTVAGLALYGFAGDTGAGVGALVAQLSGMGHGILGLGVLLGLSAFGHGLMIGRIAGQFAELGADDADLENQADRVGRNARVSAYLTIGAVVLMSLARTLPNALLS